MIQKNGPMTARSRLKACRELRRLPRLDSRVVRAREQESRGVGESVANSLNGVHRQERARAFCGCRSAILYGIFGARRGALNAEHVQRARVSRDGAKEVWSQANGIANYD